MMIHEFFLDHDDYILKPLKLRIIYDIIAYNANYIFEKEVINILDKRNPDIDKWDDNTKCVIRGHQADRDTAWECMYRLTKLYNSEWGEMTKEEKIVFDNIAKEYANIALTKFGWIKEEGRK